MSPSDRFVAELAAALLDVGALDCLSVDRLACLASTVSGWPGDLGSFRQELTVAWDACREPSDEELIALAAEFGRIEDERGCLGAVAEAARPAAA